MDPGESHYDAAAARARWIEEIAEAAGARAGSLETRRVFAEAAVSQLASAYERGRRAQNAYDRNSRFLTLIRNVRHSVHSLRRATELDSQGALALGITSAELFAVSVALLSYLEGALDRREITSRDELKPRRGRRNRIEIEVVQMLALEYFLHFGRPPGISKQSDKNNPFIRICKVVEKIVEGTILHIQAPEDRSLTLAAVLDRITDPLNRDARVEVTSPRLSIGHEARSEGIHRAGIAALRKHLGMKDGDLLSVSNPWSRFPATAGSGARSSSQATEWGDKRAKKGEKSL